MPSLSSVSLLGDQRCPPTAIKSLSVDLCDGEGVEGLNWICCNLEYQNLDPLDKKLHESLGNGLK